MKCSKCGQECRDKQRICVKCGTPLPVIPELHGFEEELANEVGDLLDEAPPKISYISLDDEEDEEDFHVLHDMIDLEDDDYADEDDLYDYEDDDIVFGNEFSLDDMEQALHAKEAKRKKDEEASVTVLMRKKKQLEEKKKRKKMLIITGCASIIVIILGILLGLYLRNSHFEKSYKENYESSITYYDSGNYDQSLLFLEKAQGYAKKDSQFKDIMIRKYLAYFAKKDYASAEKEVKELIQLDENDVTYYKALIDIYQKTGNAEGIESLLKSAEGKSFYDILVDYNIDKPLITIKEEEGCFARISISLVSGEKLFYTIAKDKEAADPISKGLEYKEELLIMESGTWYISAVSKSANGVYSEITTASYEVKLLPPKAPVVTPSDGEYQEETKISVEIPKKGKVYYTIDAELDLYELEEAIEYKEPFDMEKGNHIYRFVVEGENGLYCDIETKFFNYSMKRTYSYDDAVKMLKQKLYGQGILANSSGKYDDNTVVLCDYETVAVIDKAEYYVIAFSMITDSGITVADEILYGVHAVTGKVVNVEWIGTDAYKIVADVKLELPKEEPTTPEAPVTPEEPTTSEMPTTESDAQN